MVELCRTDIDRWLNCVEQILTDAKLQIGKRGKKSRADWEKCIEEAKVRIGL